MVFAFITHMLFIFMQFLSQPFYLLLALYQSLAAPQSPISNRQHVSQLTFDPPDQFDHSLIVCIDKYISFCQVYATCTVCSFAIWAVKCIHQKKDELNRYPLLGVARCLWLHLHMHCLVVQLVYVYVRVVLFSQLNKGTCSEHAQPRPQLAQQRTSDSLIAWLTRLITNCLDQIAMHLASYYIFFSLVMLFYYSTCFGGGGLLPWINQQHDFVG